MNSNIRINGNSICGRFSGGDISINNGKVTVDGEVVNEFNDSQILKIEIKGSVGNVECDKCLDVSGNIEGDVKALENVNCGNINGDVKAGKNVNCGNVDCDVMAGKNVNCNNVGGDVKAKGNVCM